MSDADLPAGFDYPSSLRRLIKRGIIDLEPWYFLDAVQAKDMMLGMAERYPERGFVPFARREDNDDVACFSMGVSGKVFVVHDYSSKGWEVRLELEFYDWFRRAVENMIEFDILEEV